MSNCLVIGGSGFLGSHLVSQLLASKRAVTVLDRNTNPLLGRERGAEYISGDFADRDLTKPLLKSHDEVVDLAYATVPKASFRDPLADLLQNLPSAVQLFEEIIAAGNLRRVVFVSSGGTVYGEAETLPINERCPTFPLSPYGVTKLAIEKYAHLYFATHGLPILCLRPGNAYGEGQRPYTGQGFIATAIASIMDGRPVQIFGEDGAARDYVHASDIGRAIVLALERGAVGETYNVGSGISHSNAEVIEAILPYAAASGYRVTVEILPRRPFDVHQNVLDSAKLRKDTGWSPSVSFEEGIQRTWGWFLEKRKSERG